MHAGLDLERAPFFRDAPEPPVGLDWVMVAFRELSTCRPAGMDVGEIPFTALSAYADRFDVGEFDDFVMMIRAMDRAYLNFQRDRTR